MDHFDSEDSLAIYKPKDSFWDDLRMIRTPLPLIEDDEDLVPPQVKTNTSQSRTTPIAGGRGTDIVIESNVI
jgi:hypothetical protein